MLILLLCMVLALVPILSAIGICERCQIQSGGVYFLVSHILGGQIGGAVGVLYAFGQVKVMKVVKNDDKEYTNAPLQPRTLSKVLGCSQNY